MIYEQLSREWQTNNAKEESAKGYKKKKCRAYRVGSPSVCFPYLWTAVLVLITRQFILLKGIQDTVYFAFSEI